MNQKLIEPRQTIKALKNIKRKVAAVLPIGHSFIPFDILLSAYCGDGDGNDLTVKGLFASLPYSDMGIRYHFNKLIQAGWIELHNGDLDTRIKRIKPTEKLKIRFELVDDEFLLQIKNIRT